MNEKKPTPEELIEAVSQELSNTPLPADDAIERARQAFLTGAVTPIAMRRVERETRRVPFVAAAAAAAVAAIAVYLFGHMPADSWSVVSSKHAFVNEESTRHASAEFPSGIVATDPSGELDVQLGDRLRLRLVGDSRVRVPEGPGRWFGKSSELVVESGEVFGTTAGGELGFELAIVTPEATTFVTGTTFAVRRTPNGTCVCLYEGSVEVELPDGKRIRPLTKEGRVQVFRDGRSPLFEALGTNERHLLQDLMTHGLADSR